MSGAYSVWREGEMTTKELSQIYYLNREIDICQKQLEKLEQQRGLNAVKLDDMPHAKGVVKSQVEELAAEIVDLQAIIHAKQIECLHEQNRLRRYIREIPDMQTQQIFELRFVECLSWIQVADRIGGNSADSVKKRCYRYLKKNE